METSTPNGRPGGIFVAVPVKDEAEHIGPCLRALTWQRDVRGHRAVLLVNNTSDGTAEVVRGLAPSLPMPVHVVECRFPPAQSNAGHARRCAMDAALSLAGPGGVLLTTDADGRVASDWLSRNLAALDAGAEAVCGRAVLAPEDYHRIPPHLHAADGEECAYGATLDEMAALLDPDPNDPWPRHAEHSGASLCTTVEAYLRCGGIPDIPAGEDRAFVDALRRCDTVIRHAPDVVVQVSGRIWGRAVGGMADTIRRRLVRPDPELDDRLEPVAQWSLRYRSRAQARVVWATRDAGLATALSRRLRVRVAEVRRACAMPHFGAAWAALEEVSPLLVRRRVTVAGLPAEMATANRLLQRLRTGAPGSPSAAAAISRAKMSPVAEGAPGRHLARAARPGPAMA